MIAGVRTRETHQKIQKLKSCSFHRTEAVFFCACRLHTQGFQTTCNCFSVLADTMLRGFRRLAIAWFRARLGQFSCSCKGHHEPGIASIGSSRLCAALRFPVQDAKHVQCGHLVAAWLLWTERCSGETRHWRPGWSSSSCNAICVCGLSLSTSCAVVLLFMQASRLLFCLFLQFVTDRPSSILYTLIVFCKGCNSTSNSDLKPAQQAAGVT